MSIKFTQVQCFCHASCCKFDYYSYYLLMDLLTSEFPGSMLGPA